MDGIAIIDEEISLGRTEEMVRRVEAFISTMEEKRWIRDVVSTVGASKRETAIFKASVAVYEGGPRASLDSVRRG